LGQGHIARVQILLASEDKKANSVLPKPFIVIVGQSQRENS
jgi:hypothetical protein